MMGAIMEEIMEGMMVEEVIFRRSRSVVKRGKSRVK